MLRFPMSENDIEFVNALLEASEAPAQLQRATNILQGISAEAQEFVNDIAGDFQEGGTGEGIEKWSAVVGFTWKHRGEE
jgi:hypothetical protein